LSDPNICGYGGANKTRPPLDTGYWPLSIPCHHAADDYPPALVLRATLALDFMAFTEFAFGVVRPNTQ
jgi:hypothetical protein